MPEKEYIEREAVLSILDGLYQKHLAMHNYSADSATLDCIEAVIESPTADVAEVKHGYWHDIYLITPWVATGICSACKTLSYINPDFPYFKRCPECGAFMDDWERKTEAERVK